VKTGNRLDQTKKKAKTTKSKAVKVLPSRQVFDYEGKLSSREGKK
jgi:hypothetical protein